MPMIPRPFRHPWFARFTGAVFLGSVGDEVSKLAMPLLVLDLTHSLAAAATLRIVQLVPYVLFGALAGALIDRAEKRRLLIASDAARFAVTAIVPLSVAAGLFSLPLLYVVAFALGTLDVAWTLTTDFSVVPSLVERDELTEANAAYLGGDRVARIVGPALGGVAIGLSGNANALWISALAYLPTLVVFVVMPPIYEVDAPTAPATPRTIAREIGEGFRALYESRILRALLVLMFVTNLGNNGIQTLLLFVLSEEHHVDPTAIGIALSLSGMVQILGSVFAPAIARGRPLGHTMIGIAIGAGVGALAAALMREWRLIVATIAARQTLQAAHIIYAFLPRQREVPPRLRGRMNGAFRTVVLVANASSPALLSWIQSVASSSAAFAAAGGLALLAAGITYFSPLRHYDIREAPEQLEAVEPVAETEAEADAAAI